MSQVPISFFSECSAGGAWSPCENSILVRVAPAFKACGKTQVFCHFERSEESLFGLSPIYREILRRKARLRMTTNCFFRILFRRSLQKPGDFEFSHRLSETPGDEILLAESVVPGGRVELPTPAFSGPRSTGELPRHRSSEKIVRAREARSKRLEVRDLKMDG
jgi:hypothetical protein